MGVMGGGGMGGMGGMGGAMGGMPPGAMPGMSGMPGARVKDEKAEAARFPRPIASQSGLHTLMDQPRMAVCTAATLLGPNAEQWPDAQLLQI